MITIMSRARWPAAIILLAALAACGSTATTIGRNATPPRTPAPTPSAQTASAESLAARLKAAGLPVGHLIAYTAVTDPNHLLGRQGGYTSKVAWQDPRAISAGAGDPASDPGGTEFGGGIEVFPTASGAQARYQELRGIQPPLGDGYDYLSGNAVLRLSQYLTPAQAQAYRAAFNA